MLAAMGADGRPAHRDQALQGVHRSSSMRAA